MLLPSGPLGSPVQSQAIAYFVWRRFLLFDSFALAKLCGGTLPLLEPPDIWTRHARCPRSNRTLADGREARGHT